jgi:hypothetical protein
MSSAFYIECVHNHSLRIGFVTFGAAFVAFDQIVHHLYEVSVFFCEFVRIYYICVYVSRVCVVCVFPRVLGTSFIDYMSVHAQCARLTKTAH